MSGQPPGPYYHARIRLYRLSMRGFKACNKKSMVCLLDMVSSEPPNDWQSYSYTVFRDPLFTNPTYIKHV